MKRIFRVTIYYVGNVHQSVDAIARNDIEAREKAIKHDVREYKSIGEIAPEVDYCEIEYMTEAVQ